MEAWQRTPAATQGQSFGMLQSGFEVWITGIGLVSSVGSGVATHWDALSNGSSRVNVDTSKFAPYPVHPLADISLEGQIQSKADLRQMGRWQQIGVYAAGLALDDAQLKGEAEQLSATDLVVAAGNGERDAGADAAILKALGNAAPNAASLNAALQTSLRPTLYLGELSNLLAGNISIVHGVTNSSRTFKGEEQAGVAAFQDAASRIWNGTSHMALVGGACNAERHDLHLSLELCNCLWRGGFEPIRRRITAGGGVIPGSIGSFIVLEEADHARSRGVRPYARVTGVAAERMELSLPQAFRSSGEARSLDATSHLVQAISQSPIDVLSGASGVQTAMEREMGWVRGLERDGAIVQNIRFFGDVVGHGIEVHFLTGVALAAISIAKGRFYPSFAEDDDQSDYADSTDAASTAASQRTLVTGFGHWRGAGAALLESVEVAR